MRPLFSMKAVILINPYLAKESEFYQPNRLKEEFERFGVACDILPNVWRAEIRGGEISETLSTTYEICVYLDKDKYTPRMLEKRGMRLFNRAEAVELCDDKMLTHIALSDCGIPMPRTVAAPLCYKNGARLGEFQTGLRFPIVVKECYGSFGEQVYLARDEGELSALRERLKYRPHLYQEFVETSAGRDVRVICIGGKVIAAMKRTAENDFRSNIGLGGKGEPFALDEAGKELCEKVASRLGLDYCGIDLLFGEEGFLVCEVNSNAFFGGIERVTGVNIARLYAEYMIKCAKI